MPRHRSQKDCSQKDCSGKVGHLPLLLARLIYATRASGGHGHGGDITAIVEILRRSGALAHRAVSVHGLCAVSHQDITAEIEQLAKSYLGLDQARQAVRQALNEVEPSARREAIAVAQQQVLEAQVTSHFYAGVAFGVTMADAS